MTPKKLIIGYLEHIPSKTCTVLGLAILFQHYGIEKELTSDMLFQLYLDGDVLIIDNEEQHKVQVKLIPKLKLVK